MHYTCALEVQNLLRVFANTYFRCGRPKIDVSVEEIEFLRQLRFSWTKIAEILGISRSTLYRRLDEESITVDTTYSDISDSELDRTILRIKQVHPNDGERMLIGHLTRLNIFIPRTRVRASIHRVDPIGTTLRQSVTVRRRTYHSESPNYVWHADGHHKLIKWRFVTHGAIDGYSRLITYLNCADNNRAATVLESFQKAVNEFGLPQKVRTDLGGENVEVWRYMIEQHANNSAVITGASTHNQRIERMWRDVHRCVAVLFADTFRMLENDGKLDSLNEVDMFCLHYIYKPRINSALQSFMESWNNHSLSSASSCTPTQLYIQGMLATNTFPAQPTTTSHITSMQTLVTEDRVEVPRITFEPCTILHLLLSTVNPLQQSSQFGCDIYEAAIRIVGGHLQSGCSNCTM